MQKTQTDVVISCLSIKLQNQYYLQILQSRDTTPDSLSPQVFPTEHPPVQAHPPTQTYGSSVKPNQLTVREEEYVHLERCQRQ
ncbi:hypothetical protein Bca101_045696 [Brassica carinata]